MSMNICAKIQLYACFFFPKIFEETLSSDLSTLVKRRQNGIPLRSTNWVAVN